MHGCMCPDISDDALNWVLGMAAELAASRQSDTDQYPHRIHLMTLDIKRWKSSSSTSSCFCFITHVHTVWQTRDNFIVFALQILFCFVYSRTTAALSSALKTGTTGACEAAASNHNSGEALYCLINPSASAHQASRHMLCEQHRDAYFAYLESKTDGENHDFPNQKQ